jgi:CheY-like chemotaxis protein
MSGEAQMVMLIENDEDVREIVRDVLAARGYHVLVADHGQHALELLEAGRPAPSVILTDLAMPVMDGWEFLAAKQERPAIATIPVVVMSATDLDRAVARTHGAVDVVRKPLTLDLLVATVERFRPHAC